MFVHCLSPLLIVDSACITANSRVLNSMHCLTQVLIYVVYHSQGLRSFMRLKTALQMYTSRLGEQMCVCFGLSVPCRFDTFIYLSWSVTVILVTPAPLKLMWCETKSHNYSPPPTPLFFAIKPIIVLPPLGSLTR